MRKGQNPQKEAVLEQGTFTHLIVIPVYIPRLTDYYAESFKILRSCLLSLQKTVHSKTFISIVNNGSCKEVLEYLNEIYNTNIIHELIHTENIGKTNAILKGIQGHNIQLVTIADADILFKNNWQQETFKIFQNFPKAAVVGLIPQFKMFSTYSYNIIFDKFWSKKLKFTKVKDPKAMQLFYKSIGWKDDYNKDYLKQHLSITVNDCTAILGSGHAVATYRVEIFLKLKHHPSNYKLGGDSETKILDTSVLKLDGWRVTTPNNNAYHMGNTWETWMQKELDILNENITIEMPNLQISDLELKPFLHFMKSRLFKKLLKFKPFYRFFLKIKHLPQQMIETY